MIPIQDNIPSRNVPWATWGLILVNGLVFLHELSLSPQSLQQLVTGLGMVPARLGQSPETWWPLLTCMFLHGGWMHFIGNMWTLVIFGDNVEDRMGSGRFLGFYLLCGLAASLTHALTNPTSTIPTIGASGAVAGVLGAYFLLFPMARVITLVPLLFIPLIVEIPAIFYLGLWFVSQLLNGTLALIGLETYELVAWWAHVGGFVAGMALLPLFKQSPRQYRRRYDDEYWPW